MVICMEGGIGEPKLNLFLICCIHFCPNVPGKGIRPCLLPTHKLQLKQPGSLGSLVLSGSQSRRRVALISNKVKNYSTISLKNSQLFAMESYDFLGPVGAQCYL